MISGEAGIAIPMIGLEQAAGYTRPSYYDLIHFDYPGHKGRAFYGGGETRSSIEVASRSSRQQDQIAILNH